ncbi:NADP-dependent oxidoreductase [Corticicoccus populi]|uniref:NADP-dependent oxidoreductase n=1 Tax=Corticicoccus populi TaxID=1812821 RepID=A0ABW5WZL8_9STAP
MKAMTIEKYGNTPLKMNDMPFPVIGDDEVLVKIHAASINPVDFKIRNGGGIRLFFNYKMPLILGNDFSGEVVDTGSRVTDFKKGDKVYGRPRKSKIGTFAEYISVDYKEIAAMPENLSFEEAAAVPLVGLTSYQALNDRLNLKAGDKIFIPAGSGGIGTFAIQLAKIMGLYIATTTSDKGRELAKSMGADEVINYKDADFSKVLKDYDAVFDTMGKKNLEDSFKILKKGGKIVSINGSPNVETGKEHQFNLFKNILLKMVSRKITKLSKTYNVDYEFFFMKSSGKQLDIINTYINDDKITPVVDKVFAFKDTQKAIEYSESGRAKGKIIVKMI